MRTIRLLTDIHYNLHHLTAAKQSFEQLHPEVCIEVEQCPDHYAMLQAYQSAEPPDIIETGGYPLGNQAGIFVDLDPYVASVEGLEEDLHAGLIRAARYGGGLFALPVEVSAPLIVYNKRMFDRACLSYPIEGWTWDEMMAAARKLTIHSDVGEARQFGFGIGVDIEWFEPFVMRNGGRYVAPDGSTARGYVDNTATIEAFRLLVDAFRIQQVIRKPDERAAAGHWTEESAMTFCFTWNAQDLLQASPDGRFAAVGLPKMPGPGATEANMIYMGGAGITNKSAHQQLAWHFLRHYILENHTWFPPLSKSQTKERGIDADPIWSRYVEELAHVQPGAFFLNRKWNASRQLINEEIRKMILEGADVARTLQSWTRYA